MRTRARWAFLFVSLIACGESQTDSPYHSEATSEVATKPPQFVLLSFDGSYLFDYWHRTRAFAQEDQDSFLPIVPYAKVAGDLHKELEWYAAVKELDVSLFLRAQTSCSSYAGYLRGIDIPGLEAAAEDEEYLDGPYARLIP